MLDLYQIILLFPCLVFMAELMFQTVSMVLLCINPLVFAQPSPHPIFSQLLYCILCYWHANLMEALLNGLVSYQNSFAYFLRFYSLKPFI